MASSVGDAILSMMGQKDPRQQIIEQMMGGGGANPYPNAPVISDPNDPRAVPGVDPTATGAVPPQPDAYTSPPDLMQLYSSLIERSENASQMNRGLGLMGSALAQPENREGIEAAFGIGGGGGSGAMGNANDFLTNIMALKANSAALQSKAASRAALPAIAEQYGLDIKTAQYLFDSGKLDSVIQDLEKPNKQIVENSDGTHAIVDLNDGSVGESLGVPAKPKVKWEPTPDGGKVLIREDTGMPVGGAGTEMPSVGATDDIKELIFANKERTARGEKPLTNEEYIDLKKTKPARPYETKIVEETSKAASETFKEEYDSAAAAKDVLISMDSARDALDRGIISGSGLSPAEKEGRKVWADVFGISDEKADNTDEFQTALKDTVMSKIKTLGSGSGITDSDRKFTEAAVGADTTMSETTIRRIFEIIEKGARTAIEKQNQGVEEYLTNMPTEDEQELKDRATVARNLRRVQMPELKKRGEYRGGIPSAAPASAAAPAPAPVDDINDLLDIYKD